MTRPPLSPTEQHLWDPDEVFELEWEPTDSEIEEKYESRQWRIVTESNREHLPNFVDALARKGWMDLRPVYQRRPRWDVVRQSKLIESFIMNVPVPPLFIYERKAAEYEIMDGQQRVTAIRSFYRNEYALAGLDHWSELNGRLYSQLPQEIRKGLDRRSISYTILLQESAGNEEQKTLLRQLVFERLNTGGVSLSQQEVRNCIYQGPFNTLLLELSRNPVFRSAWDMPLYTPEEDTPSPPPLLLKNAFFKRMGDLEAILRFFALRHLEHYRKGMQGFLDLYMVRSRLFTDEDLAILRQHFTRTLDLAFAIYGEQLFQPWVPEEREWAGKAQLAFSDAVMVGLFNNLTSEDALRRNAAAIKDGTRDLISNSPDGTFTGRGNSKNDVEQRIGLMTQMIRSKV